VIERNRVIVLLSSDGHLKDMTETGSRCFVKKIKTRGKKISKFLILFIVRPRNAQDFACKGFRQTEQCFQILGKVSTKCSDDARGRGNDKFE